MQAPPGPAAGWASRHSRRTFYEIVIFDHTHMGILTKYLCKEFVKLLLFCQTSFVFLYLVIDFIQKIDNFMEEQASNYSMLLFFLYKIPLIAVQMAPVAALARTARQGSPVCEGSSGSTGPAQALPPSYR